MLIHDRYFGLSSNVISGSNVPTRNERGFAKVMVDE
jgi:hypothetical protein